MTLAYSKGLHAWASRLYGEDWYRTPDAQKIKASFDEWTGAHGYGFRPPEDWAEIEAVAASYKYKPSFEEKGAGNKPFHVLPPCMFCQGTEFITWGGGFIRCVKCCNARSILSIHKDTGGYNLRTYNAKLERHAHTDGERAPYMELSNVQPLFETQSSDDDDMQGAV